MLQHLESISTKVRNIFYMVILIAYYNNVPLKSIIITLAILVGIDCLISFIDIKKKE